MNTQRNLRQLFALIIMLGLTMTFVARSGRANYNDKQSSRKAALFAVGPTHGNNLWSMKSTNPYPALATAVTSDASLLQWNEIAVATIGTQPPFAAARFMAIVQVAVFEAVNAITGEYEPYLGTVNAPSGASTEAAAVTAAHGTLKALFPAQGATLDLQRANSLATITDGQAKTDGIAVGEAAAAAIIANRTNDGSAPPQFHTPANSDPYEWQATPGCLLGGVFKHWPNVKPFGVLSSSQFRADPPPKLTSGSYARDLNEVQAIGDINSTLRPQDRTDVAVLYNAQGGHYFWNSALRQIASTRQDDITTTARIAAVMNMSISDAFVTVVESKYLYRTWRPVTAIPRADEDGNAHTTPSSFTPLITTPCHPSYPSGHASGSAAALEVLERAYGRFSSVTVSHTGVPGVVLNYTDVSDARVFGGIHYRSDQDAGERMGRDVGRYINHNKLRPINGED
jgi:hypothetical protein